MPLLKINIKIMSSKFLGINITWANDDLHEKCYLDLRYNDKFVGIISQEDSAGTIHFESLPDDCLSSMVSRKVEVDILIEMIRIAKLILKGEAVYDCGVLTQIQTDSC